jgi:hypothetical protein
VVGVTSLGACGLPLLLVFSARPAGWATAAVPVPEGCPGGSALPPRRSSWPPCPAASAPGPVLVCAALVHGGVLPPRACSHRVVSHQEGTPPSLFPHFSRVPPHTDNRTVRSRWTTWLFLTRNTLPLSEGVARNTRKPVPDSPCGFAMRTVAYSHPSTNGQATLNSSLAP